MDNRLLQMVKADKLEVFEMVDDKVYHTDEFYNRNIHYKCLNMPMMQSKMNQMIYKWLYQVHL